MDWPYPQVLALCVVAALAATAVAGKAHPTGRISLDLVSPPGAHAVQAWAIDRVPHILVTSKGVKRDIGMYGKTLPGRVNGRHLEFANLPVPGNYELKIRLSDGSTVAGWNAKVPASAFVGDPPLSSASRKAILHKLGNDQFTAFPDDMRLLDMTGNIDHAAALVMKLRRRPTVGAPKHAKPWILRIERWAWHTGDGPTWTPSFHRPFYALIRRRLTPADYKAIHLAYSSALGGIDLTSEKPERKLAAKILAPIPAGIWGMSATGKLIQPIIIKGRPAPASGAETTSADNASPKHGDTRHAK